MNVYIFVKKSVKKMIYERRAASDTDTSTQRFLSEGQ